MPGCDPRVDAYLAPLPPWQRDRFARVQGDPINEQALLALLRAIIANNRAGGWPKLRGGRHR